MTQTAPHIETLLDETITVAPRSAMPRTPTRLNARVITARNRTLIDVKALESAENGIALVIMTERDDNKGRSIANGSEVIATELLKKLALSTEFTSWIEHFPYSWDDIGHYYLCHYEWRNGVAHNRVGRRIEEAEVAHLCRLLPCANCGRGPALRAGGCPRCTP